MKWFVVFVLAGLVAISWTMVASRRTEGDSSVRTRQSGKPVEIVVVRVAGQVEHSGDVALGLPYLSDLLTRCVPTPLADLRKIKVRRSGAAGASERLEIDAVKIRSGEAPDVPLRAGDLVYVSERIL